MKRLNVCAAGVAMFSAISLTGGSGNVPHNADFLRPAHAECVF